MIVVIFILLLIKSIVLTNSNDDIFFADEVVKISKLILKDSSDEKLQLLIVKTSAKDYIPVIPLIIHQIWPNKTLMPYMNSTVTELLYHNNEFEYRLYDDNDCRHVIKRHFDKHTLYSFDHLRPGAYKADLCRYCVLYHYGGIYLDIKMKLLDKFKLKYLTDKEYYVLDRYGHPFGNFSLDLYNAVMINQKHSPILKKAIEIVNKNVKNQYYGLNYLYPTGPAVLGEAYIGDESEVRNNLSNSILKIKQFDLVNTAYNHSAFNLRVQFHNLPILRPYDEYRAEQKKYYSQVGKSKHYSYYWFTKQVYIS